MTTAAPAMANRPWWQVLGPAFFIGFGLFYLYFKISGRGA